MSESNAAQNLQKTVRSEKVKNGPKNEGFLLDLMVVGLRWSREVGVE
jgi:hypothetical protein